MPVEPPPTAWSFPPPENADAHGLVGVGADLAPGTLLAAYRAGIFPMPLPRRKSLIKRFAGGAGASVAPELTGWWSPDPRGVLPVGAVHVSRSLARTRRRFTIRVDTAFDAVVRACADPARPGGWISPGMFAAYRRLHDAGWAHSIEAWTAGGRLAGGVFGLAIGGLFAGESMFHHERDASKAALAALGDLLATGAGPPEERVLDVQWTTPHLCSLGALDLARADYLERLAVALAMPLPPAFAGPHPRWPGARVDPAVG